MKVEHIDVTVGTGITMSAGRDHYVKPSVTISQRIILEPGDNPETIRKSLYTELSKEAWALFDSELGKSLQKLSDVLGGVN